MKFQILKLWLKYLVIIGSITFNSTFSQVRSLKLGIGPSISTNLFLPDNATKKITMGGGLDINYSAFPHLGIGINAGYNELGGVRNDIAFRTSLWQLKTSLIYNILPYSEYNPFIFSGLGLIYFDPKYENGKPLPNVIEGLYQKWSILVPFGVGINIFLVEEFSVNFSADYNIAMSGYLDDLKIGNNDKYLSFKVSLTYYFFDKWYILEERRNKQK
jgi:hypothetical protein